ALLGDLDDARMPDANTLFNIAERLSGSFGIALLATFYAARTQVTGSPVAALHDCALLLAAVSAGGALAALTLHGRGPGRSGGLRPCPRGSPPGDGGPDPQSCRAVQGVSPWTGSPRYRF